MEKRFHIGDRIRVKGISYRILVIHQKVVLMIELDIDKMVFKTMHEAILEAFFNRDEAVIEEDKEQDYPAEKLTDIEKATIRMKRDLIDNMLEKLYPNWDVLASKKAKPELRELERKIGCSKSTATRYLRNYLQSGRNEYALADGRRQNKGAPESQKLRGAKPKYYNPERIENSPELLEIFENYFELFMKHNEKLTIKAIYDEMVMKHFADTATAPPTYKRFLWFVNGKLEEQHLTLAQAKMNARERRNNNRLLKGNAQSGIYYPGQMLEIDAVELDNYNVSLSDRNQLVGKSVMYCAVDVYSCCIVACWIGYQNNSYIGITDLLFTLLDEHVEEAARYGVELTPDIFPSRFIPTAIRTDHGAEYTSGEFSRLCGELGINHNLAAPGTGSLKGTVEQYFHGFQTMMKTQLVDAGETYPRYNSNHKKKAVLNIEESRAMMYQFVKYFNRHSRENYPFTKEMIEQGIAPCPAAIWEYGIKNIQSPKRVTDANRDTLFFALLKNDIPFKLSSKGISYKSLYYWDDSEWFYSMIMKLERENKKSAKASGFRYDPRRVDQIYRMENGRLITVNLNKDREEMNTFKGMSWGEYLELYQNKKTRVAEYRVEDDKNRLEAKAAAREIIDSAKAAKAVSGGKTAAGRNKTTEIRAARKEDGRKLMRMDTEEKDVLRMDGADEDMAVQKPENENSSEAMHIPSMEELFRMTQERSRLI